MGKVWKDLVEEMLNMETVEAVQSNPEPPSKKRRVLGAKLDFRSSSESPQATPGWTLSMKRKWQSI